MGQQHLPQITAGRHLQVVPHIAIENGEGNDGHFILPFRCGDMATTAAALAAIFDLVPDIGPLFAPGERTFTHHTNFLGQILFLHAGDFRLKRPFLPLILSATYAPSFLPARSLLANSKVQPGKFPVSLFGSQQPTSSGAIHPP